MKINFTEIEEKTLPNFKGGEKEFNARMFFDGQVRIMKGRLSPGASIGVRTHTDSSETMFFTKGSGSVIYDGEKLSVTSGDVHYCPKGHTHTLINDGDGDLEFSAVVPMQ